MNSLFKLKVIDRVIQMSRATKPEESGSTLYHDLYSCFTYNAWGFKGRVGRSGCVLHRVRSNAVISLKVTHNACSLHLVSNF